jgi:glycosyltransferase involved in cell wall biosynthesis
MLPVQSNRFVRQYKQPESLILDPQARPLRILHVVGGMVRGGIETWLMHVLRTLDRSQYQIDILVHDESTGHYDEEVQALGVRLIPCLHPEKPWIYGPEFKRILREYGPYDIVHSNVHHYSGYILRLAAQAGVPARIAHSHNDTTPLQRHASLRRRVYYRLSETLIQTYATHGLACSRPAAVSLFGSRWEYDPRWHLLYYGVNLTPFHQEPSGAALRAELGIPPDTFVIGHVGRFVYQKNHIFLIDIMSEVVRRAPEARLLLIGYGELEDEIRARVAELGLTEHVIFAGVRSDVPQLMKQVMNLFVLPSHFEGLGLVGAEAQAAGLPVVLADGVPAEADILPPLIRRLSIRQPAKVWAETILSLRPMLPGIAREKALAIIEQSDFNIRVSAQRLEQVYQSCIPHCHSLGRHHNTIRNV